MSRVTNLMLSCSVMDDDERDEDGNGRLCGAMAHVRAWCEGADLDEAHKDDRARLGFPSRTVDAVSAGTKHMECNVYAWGANYLDLDGFLRAVAAAPWECPESVQVFVMEQEDDVFSVRTLQRDRTWLCLTPGT